MTDRKKWNRKTMAGVLIGLSLAQTGGIVLPQLDLAAIVLAGDEKTEATENLRELVQRADAADASAYTDDSYQLLMKYRDQAQKVIQNDKASAGEIVACEIALNAVLDQGLIEAPVQTEESQTAGAALDELDTTVDKSVLNDLIVQAENLDLSSYDDSIADFFRKAIASAKQTAANEKATQSMVDKHIQLLEAVSAAFYGKTDANTVYDGTYQINGILRHATADQDSMGNAALVKPFQLIKNGDELKLRIECVPLTTKLGKTDFSGYLAGFWYFPDWEGDVLPAEAGMAEDVGETVLEEAQEETAEEELFSDDSDVQVQETDVTVESAPAAGEVGGYAAEVESYYDVYDSYNDPSSGTDANVKGQQYPHFIQIPIKLNQTLLWTQVYVPVMEAISTGGGRQYAKLELDWNSLVQLSGAESDKSSLETMISQAETLVGELGNDSQGFAAEQIEMLKSAVTAARAADANINVDQSIVDNVTVALNRAADACRKTKVNSDKTQLKKAIENADSYLNAVDVVFRADGLAVLKSARDKAQLFYDNEEATQTQVNLCVTAIDNAISGLVVDGADKRELKKILSKAEEVLKDKDSYSAAAYEVLKTAYDDAKAVYENKEATQSEADSKGGVLDYILSNLKKVEEASVDKSGLYDMLKTAHNMAGREDFYTEASIQTLKKAITSAESVYNSSDATKEQVKTQITALSEAMTNLSVKESSSNTDSNNNNSNSGSDSSSNKENSSLDINNLADGVYAVTGSMVKTDKKTASMSDEAINHTVKLTVKNGKYNITLDFKGLTINGQLGYLGTLKYYKSGYTTDKYGVPKGTLANVTIESYQKYTDGKKVSDNFGSNYPDVVTFPMISEAVKNGYVPLQVFVPIMDSISKGTGTQPVYLKLDWSSIKKTSSDDPSFKDTTSNDKNAGGSGSSGTSGSGTSGLNTMNIGSKLGGSSLGTTNSKLGTGSSLSTSGSDSLKKTTSKSLTADAKKSALKSGNSAGTSTTGSKKSASASKSEISSSGTGSAATGDLGKVAVPSVISTLAALSGVLYKLKSRRGLK